MADNLRRKPKKSILKNSSSFDKPDLPLSSRKSLKETTWDEMNIIATLHPADKDYGHMKIDEPKTPYNYVDPTNLDALDARTLEEKIKAAAQVLPKAMQDDDSDSDDEDDADLTPEERAKKKEFENKRKKHYNEFMAVKLARKLLEEDEEEDGEEAAAVEPVAGTSPKPPSPAARSSSSPNRVNNSSPPPGQSCSKYCAPK